MRNIFKMSVKLGIISINRAEFGKYHAMNEKARRRTFDSYGLSELSLDSNSDYAELKKLLLPVRWQAVYTSAKDKVK